MTEQYTKYKLSYMGPKQAIVEEESQLQESKDFSEILKGLNISQILE
jgi:hypothetical protein